MGGGYGEVVGLLLLLIALVAVTMSYANIVSFESSEVRRFWGGVRLRGSETMTTTLFPSSSAAGGATTIAASSQGSSVPSVSPSPPSATLIAGSTTTSGGGGAASTTVRGATTTTTGGGTTTTTVPDTVATSTPAPASADVLPATVCGRRIARSSPISTSAWGRDCSALSKVVEVGNDDPFGRTNNRLLEIFHAFDKAWEDNAFLATSRWAAEDLSAFDTSAFNRVLCAKSFGDLTSAEKAGADKVNSQVCGVE